MIYPSKAQAIVVENPGAKIYGEVENIRTYDFTYCQSWLHEGLKLALRSQGDINATPTEQALALTIIEIAKAVGMS